MTGICDLDAVDLAQAIGSRAVSCLDVMTACLDRIDAVNPRVNAIVSMRPRAALLAEARRADVDHSVRGPLHGFPFAVKDLVETAGIRTTHGSPLFADNVPLADALLAARIRASGAILIGKTNTPEFGLGSHSFNPVHGVTRNPYDLARTAGGSSGGAAAALASRMVPLADGSDAMGSLRNPAAFCNVYGFRPSFGRVPRDPSGELFFSQLSTDGPMARSVRDIALLLDVIAGPAPHDPHALGTHEAFLHGLDEPSRAVRVGWIGDWAGGFALEAGIADICAAALGVFTAIGVTVESVTPSTDLPRLLEAWRVLRSFANAADKRHLLDDPATRERIKPELVYEIESGLSRTAMEVHAASVARSQWFVEAARLFERYDALILPSAQVFPFDAELRWPDSIAGRRMATYHGWMEVVVPASIAGLPTLAVPAGFSATGLPMGLQLIGRRGADLPILQLGEAYHRATGWPQRRPPALD